MSSSKGTLWIVIGFAQIVFGLIIRPIAAFNAFIPIWICMISLGLGAIGIGISDLGWRKLASVPSILSIVCSIYMLYEIIMFFVRAYA